MGSEASRSDDESVSSERDDSWRDREREREIRSRIGGGRVIERQQIEDQDLSLRFTLIDNDDEDKECVAAAGVCAVWHCGESCRGSSLHGAAGESFA